MDNMVKIKEEVDAEENTQIRIGFGECKVAIKKETSEVPRLEAPLKENQSFEDPSSVSESDLHSANHCFPPEFIICKNDPYSCNDEINDKTQVPQQSLKLGTEGSAASDLWLPNNKDTDNCKAEELSPVESRREPEEDSRDEIYILPFSSDTYLQKKNCVVITEHNTGSQETNIFHGNDAGIPSSVEDRVHSLNSKPTHSNQKLESHTLASALSSFIREVHKCTVCEKTFPLRIELRKHYLIHKEPLKCTVCEKTFTQMRKLKNHYLTHDGKKPYQCKDCGRSFSQKYSLKKHNLIH